MTEPDQTDVTASHLRPETAGSALFRGARASAYWFGSDGSLVAKGLRFGLVGATSGLIFACTTALLISGAAIDETLASMIGYVISMPVNFFANRSFSFRSQGHILSDAMRYAALHIVNIAVTAGAMEAAVNALGVHYVFGIIGAIVLVPLANFVLMEIWVFGRPAQR
jgi:putative flippase GtrA